MDREAAAALAKALASTCVRNTFLEDLHAGTAPSTKAGDYSDVKVTSPYGDIPWERLSRISDEEMKKLMKEIVDNLFTVLTRLGDGAFMAELLRRGAQYTSEWDEPNERPDLVITPEEMDFLFASLEELKNGRDLSDEDVRAEMRRLLVEKRKPKRRRGR